MKTLHGYNLETMYLLATVKDASEAWPDYDNLIVLEVGFGGWGRAYDEYVTMLVLEYYPWIFSEITAVKLGTMKQFLILSEEMPDIFNTLPSNIIEVINRFISGEFLENGENFSLYKQLDEDMLNEEVLC